MIEFEENSVQNDELEKIFWKEVKDFQKKTIFFLFFFFFFYIYLD